MSGRRQRRGELWATIYCHVFDVEADDPSDANGVEDVAGVDDADAVGDDV